MTYVIGIAGVWLLCDGVIGAAFCLAGLAAVDKTGERIRGWKYIVSTRLIRAAIGLGLMLLAWA